MYKLFCLRFSHFRIHSATVKNLFAFFKNNLLEGWLKVGIITLILGFSLALYPVQIANAANALHSEPYQNGPIRQTRNPISNENYQGGIEPSVLNQPQNAPQTPQKSKSFLKTLKDKIFGSSSKSENTRIDLKTRKNPTLDRYTNQQ